MKNKLIMLSGLPASGKSTYAQELQYLYPDSVRVNKDLISEMLHFRDFTPDKRKDVLALEEMIVQMYLDKGKTVIVDDTNLGQRYEDKWNHIAECFDAEFVKIFMDTPYQECVWRDLNRENSVGADVITNFALELGLVDKKFIICDLDGTLCDIADRRHLVNAGGGEKDWKAFFENIPGDKVRHEVSEIIIDYYNRGFEIVYLTGRPEEYKEETVEWLRKNYLSFNFSLIMRKKGDRRPDVEVKREMLNKYFKDRSKIYGVIDDRPCVVRMWKEELGNERVLDVGDGIEF